MVDSSNLRKSPLISHFPRLLLSLFVFGVALWLYTSTTRAGFSLENGDFTEMQRASYRLGIARSTGYPIYTLLGYIASHLGETLDQNPYTWVTYSSAAATALAVLLFFQLALRLAPASLAVAITLALAFSNTLWHNATVPDVQGLNAVSVVGMVWMLVVHLQEPRRIYPLVGLAFFAGLSLANHRTGALVLPAALVGIILTGAWLRLSWKQWLMLVLVFALPLTSYTYLYIRARDPHVVFSTRPTWFPAGLGQEEVTDIIIGKNQSGQSLGTFYKFPQDDFSARFDFVHDNLTSDLTRYGVWLGVIGLLLLLVVHWRLGLVMVIYSLTWLIFLMGWRLEKGVLYQYPLVIALVIGITVLGGILAQGIIGGLHYMRKASQSWRLLLDGRKRPLAFNLITLLSLPIFALAFHLYHTNRPIRTFHDPKNPLTGQYVYDQMKQLPPDSMLWAITWSSETFILLEYLDTAGRQDVLPRETALWWVPLDDMRNPNFTTYIGPTMRSMYNFFDGATWFPQESGLAFAGTGSQLFIQALPKNDPRIQQQADAATPLHFPIAPEVELYSYHIETRNDGIFIALYWRAIQPIQTHYSVYTHLRQYAVECQEDTVLRLLSQDDAYTPVEGAYATWLWSENEIVKDTYLIPWPDGTLPSSGLAIALGMTQNGQRMNEFCIPYNDINTSPRLRFIGG